VVGPHGDVNSDMQNRTVAGIVIVALCATIGHAQSSAIVAEAAMQKNNGAVR
jgi:hypothetical protein